MKNASPDKWNDGGISCSVSGLSTTSYGTSITFSVRLYSGSGSTRDQTFYYTTTVNAYVDPTPEPTAGATVPTLNKAGAKLGETVTISMPRGDSRYTHTLYYRIGTGSSTQFASGQGTSYTWTVPKSLINVVKSADTQCVITCATYYGASLVGSNVVSLKLSPADEFLPTVSEGWFTVARYDSPISEWVAGHCKARVTFDASKVSFYTDASLSKFSVQYGTGDPVEVSQSPYIVTTDTLQEVNAVIKVSVTDTNGFTTSSTYTVPTLAYYPPTITDITVYRSNSSGTRDVNNGKYIAVRATAGCYGYSGKNQVTLTAAYKPNGGSYVQPITIPSNTLTVINSSQIDLERSYIVKFVATDTIGTSVTTERTVGTRQITFHLREGGDGAGFGKYSETANKFECAWDADFDEDVNVDGDLSVSGDVTVTGSATVGSLTIGESTLFDLIYPVGAIYFSTVSTSPATLFGGTWVQIKDKFLLASGDTYTAGDSGGSATQTLTVSEMPSHSHAVSIVEGGSHSHSYGQGSPCRAADGSYWNTAGSGASTYSDTTSTDGEHSHSAVAGNTGSGTAFSIMPPYLAVYAWKRTQ